MSLMKIIENKVIDPFHHICNQFFNNDVYMGGVTLSGVETLLFPPIHSPVITDPPLSSRNPYIAVIYIKQHRMKLAISTFL